MGGGRLEEGRAEGKKTQEMISWEQKEERNSGPDLHAKSRASFRWEHR
jgi:hypothetical protein